jgi:hypothetical protein
MLFDFITPTDFNWLSHLLGLSVPDEGYSHLLKDGNNLHQVRSNLKDGNNLHQVRSNLKDGNNLHQVRSNLKGGNNLHH